MRSTQLVLFPVAFLEATSTVNHFSDAGLDELALLSIINASIWVEQHSYWTCLAKEELTLVNYHVGHQELLVLAIESVILEVADVHAAVRHDHPTVRSLIVLPNAIKDAAISPDHLTMALTLSLAEVSSILGYLKLNSGLGGEQGILILELTSSIWSTIFEGSEKLIAVRKLDAAGILQAGIHYAARVFAILVLALLYLEEIAELVLYLTVSIGLVADELPLVLTAVQELHLASAHTLI